MIRAAVFTLVLTLQPGRCAAPFDASTPFAAAPMPLGEPGQGCPLGHCQPGEPGPAQRSLAVRAADTVNVRDWLARGDGKRETPHDEGVDISTASWNDWKKYPFYTDKAYSPYWVTGAFKPPRPTPFVSTDTWDSIGINLAVWNAAGQAEVFLPAGCVSLLPIYTTLRLYHLSAAVSAIFERRVRLVAQGLLCHGGVPDPNDEGDVFLDPRRRHVPHYHRHTRECFFLRQECRAGGQVRPVLRLSRRRPTDVHRKSLHLWPSRVPVGPSQSGRDSDGEHERVLFPELLVHFVRSRVRNLCRAYQASK